jgi:tetratricopeptide (TPR) repeat protein
VDWSKLIREFRERGASTLTPHLGSLLEAANNSDLPAGRLYFVADICIELRRHDEAAHVLESIDRKIGLSDIGWNNLGHCYDELGRNEEAISAYFRSLSLNPENLSSIRNLAIICLDDSERLSWAQVWNEKQPDSAEGLVYYVTAIFNTGRHREALAVLRHSKERCQGDLTDLADLETEIQQRIVDDT